ncbi:MAG: pilus assembly protein [Sphingomonas sp.]|uniref:TadE/TadG family type IV pilus assembly protein n=1 Tax=Sphingomonas sp. TaxID=28214 RepID=UPI0025D36299|nr:TadE/TadG family type IV pilus assembly protein [Sphingomonas sp.]MBY0285269.1 pilus assembly protein [Sphingomonas sp.]
MTDSGNWRGGVMQTLNRVARDQRGNVLAMSALLIFVTVVLAGSSVDTARLYLVKARLQQACDSGVLAGRRFMVDSASTTLDANASTQATNFFNNNFKAGWLQTTGITFTPAKTSDNRVSATASAVVPMTLTRLFNIIHSSGVVPGSQTINVTCEARYDLADTDIMFVLDTTGSMACLPSEDNATCSATVNSQGTSAYTRPADSPLGAGSGSVNDSVAGYPGSFGYHVNERSGSRISALRTAVISFYNTMAANIQPGTNIRYGFVTYTSVVNAGRAIQSINPQFMVGGAGNATTNWTYQSRRVTADYQISATNTTFTGRTSAQCNALIVPRNPATALTYNTSTQQATESTVSWSSGSGGTCVVTARVYGPTWTYGPTSHNVSNFLTNTAVDDPTTVDGSTDSWQGCIEERNTTASASFDINNLPADLDPDLVPTNDATRWRPAWPEVIYGRNYTGGTYGYTSTGTTTSNGETNSIAIGLSYARYNTDQLLRAGWFSCGKPVRRLSTMSLTDVTNYVNAPDFRPIGGTYHDTGMTWGLRMISPNGIFANDTAAWPGRNPPNRVIVFLTDGAMAPNVSIYGQYGVEYFDRRVTGGTFTSQTDYHNARFLALCAKAKSMNISIWTVALGLAATPELQQCASSAQQSLSSTSGSDLNTQFQSIAQRVARLRVSQ